MTTHTDTTLDGGKLSLLVASWTLTNTHQSLYEIISGALFYDLWHDIIPINYDVSSWSQSVNDAADQVSTFVRM